MKKKSLKNQIADIIVTSGLVQSTETGNTIVCETTENNARYEFPAEMTKELLKRAGRKSSPVNLCDTSHFTQERLVYLRDNPCFLEALLLIRKSIELTQSFRDEKADVNDMVSKAVKRNKDYTPYFKYSNFGWYSFDSKGRKVYIKQYIDMLPIVPKAWIYEVQKNSFPKLR